MSVQIHPEDLVADLAYLRKGEGFTAARLGNVGLVAELLRGGSAEEFGRLRSRFASAIRSLEPAESELLLDVFGLGPDVAGMESLAARRRLHATKLRRGVDTVAGREPPALQHLARALITGSYVQSPLLMNVPEMHDGIIYEATSTLIEVENRHWARTTEHYRFVATFDEMDFLTITRSYPAKATVNLTGQFRLNTRPTAHGFNDHFWHLNPDRTADEPMRRGETYDIAFTLEPDDPTEQTSIVNACRAFHERSLLASIKVAFRGEQPATIWSYERLSYFAQPGEPHESNQVELDGRGIATLRLRDVYGGLFSGIAWRWD